MFTREYHQAIAQVLYALDGDLLREHHYCLFGGKAAERVLLYLQTYEEGHVQLIAATMELSPSQVRAQLHKFEDLGLVGSREIGRTRLFSGNAVIPMSGHFVHSSKKDSSTPTAKRSKNIFG